jgi:hypothetical protein
MKIVKYEKLIVDGAKKLANITLSNSPKFSKKVIENAAGGLAIAVFSGSLFVTVAAANELSKEINSDTDDIL